MVDLVRDIPKDLLVRILIVSLLGLPFTATSDYVTEGMTLLESCAVTPGVLVQDDRMSWRFDTLW